MSTNISNEFANTLIKKTLSEEINWKPITDGLKINGEPITDLLGTCEFHTVYFWESYFCDLHPGRAFLVSELNESGRDGRFDTEGFNLYIQTADGKPLVSILFDTAELYRLKNAIDSKADLPQDAVSFMKSFLDKNH